MQCGGLRVRNHRENTIGKLAERVHKQRVICWQNDVLPLSFNNRDGGQNQTKYLSLDTLPGRAKKKTIGAFLAASLHPPYRVRPAYV